MNHRNRTHADEASSKCLNERFEPKQRGTQANTSVLHAIANIVRTLSKPGPMTYVLRSFDKLSLSLGQLTAGAAAVVGYVGLKSSQIESTQDKKCV